MNFEQTKIPSCFYLQVFGTVRILFWTQFLNVDEVKRNLIYFQEIEIESGQNKTTISYKPIT